MVRKRSEVRILLTAPLEDTLDRTFSELYVAKWGHSSYFSRYFSDDQYNLYPVVNKIFLDCYSDQIRNIIDDMIMDDLIRW